MTYKEVERTVLANLEQGKKSGTANNYLIVAHDRRTIGADLIQIQDWKKVSISVSLRGKPSTKGEFDNKLTESLVAAGILIRPKDSQNDVTTFDDLINHPINSKSFKVIWDPQAQRTTTKKED